MKSILPMIAPILVLFPLAAIFCSEITAQQPTPDAAAFRSGDVVAKREVPPAAKLQAASELVREVYRKRFEAATTAKEMSEVAKQIFGDANATLDDPVSRYVMLRSAREIAIRAGDVPTTLAAVNAMTESYMIDGADERTEALIAALRTSNREPSVEIQQVVYSLAQQWMDADRYESAIAVLSASLRKTRRTDSRRALTALAEEAKRLASSYTSVKAAADRLDLAPNDPAANHRLGSFLCFVKDDWTRGLAMLERSDNETLRKLAIREKATIDSSDDQMVLADQWWQFADSLQSDLRAGAKRHAGTFYQEASRHLTGLKKAKALHRLDEAKRFGPIKSLAEIRGNPSLVTDPVEAPTKEDGPPNDIEDAAAAWPANTTTVELPLDGAFDDVAIGAKGQYLLLLMSTMKKIVVLDVFTRKFVHEVELDNPNVLMTANANSLFLATPDDNKIERRSLRDFKPDRTAILPFVQPVRLIETGYASIGGPVFAASEKGPGVFLGASTLRAGSVQVVDVTYPNRDIGLPGVGAAAQVRANADASLFAHRETQYSPNTMRIMSFAGRQVRLGTLRESVGYLAPSPNGQLLYTSEGIYTNQLKAIGEHKERFATSFPLPAVTGDLTIRLVRDDDAKNKSQARMTIHKGPAPEPIATLPAVKFRPGEYGDFHHRELIGIDQRIYFYPQHRLLVTLPPSSLSVVFHRLPELDAK
tara:strand:+ start:23917 stop:26028 length:2112 start_codon:yes stop_codon:yes gene_type:complete